MSLYLLIEDIDGELFHTVYSSKEKALESYQLTHQLYTIHYPSPYEIIEIPGVDVALKNLKRIEKEMVDE